VSVNVKVLATTANMGAGFDCFGMALNLYNELVVEESEEFSVEINGVKGNASLPYATKDNLIYQVMLRFHDEVGKKMPEVRLIQTDNIPMTRGLGSSSACIVAGLFAANEMTGKPMSRDELAKMACIIEGHPDNVAPAVYGGFVVAAIENENLFHVKVEPADELSFITFIPNFQLSTAKARRILPAEYSKADVIFNISRASLFVASMMSNCFENFPIAVDDKVHQPYRGTLIPGMDTVFEYAKAEGAKGVFMSGAGPTIIAIAPRKIEKAFANKMKAHLAKLDNEWEIKILHSDITGAQVL
jgi:homoserine kinase